MVPPPLSRTATTGTLCLLYFLLMAGTFNSLGAVLPLMVTNLHMDWGQAGFGFALLGIGCGLSSLLPAILTRRFGVSRTIGFGAILLVAGFLCMASAQGTSSYYAGTLLLGVGFCIAGTTPAIHVLSALYEHPSRAIGVYFMAGGLGSVMGPLIFLAISSLLAGWRPFWAMLGLSTALIGTAAVFATRGQNYAGTSSSDPHTAAGEWGARAALRHPQLWVIIAAYTACLLINTTLHNFAVQHLTERGLSLHTATLTLSLVALVSAAASSAGGTIGRKLTPKHLTLLSLLLLILACLALLPTLSFPLLGLFVLGMGGGIGISFVSTTMLLLDYFGRRANLELYSLMCLVSTVAAVGPGIGGRLRDNVGNFQPVFLLLALIGLTMTLAVASMRKPSPHASPADHSGSSPTGSSHPAA